MRKRKAVIGKKESKVVAEGAEKMMTIMMMMKKKIKMTGRDDHRNGQNILTVKKRSKADDRTLNDNANANKITTRGNLYK